MRIRNFVDRLRGSGVGLYFAGAAALAILAGVLAAGAVRAAAPTSSVLVAARDIPPGTELSEKDLRRREIPAGARPEGAIDSMQEAVGRRVRYGLAAGDVVRTVHLVEKGTDLAERLAQEGQGMRAMLLPTEVAPAVDRLSPGERLELIAVLPVRTETEQTHVAVSLGQASVLEVVRDHRDDPVGVLVALPAEAAMRYALASRAGTVVAIVSPGDGGGHSLPNVLRLQDLTAAATGKGGQ